MKLIWTAVALLLCAGKLEGQKQVARGCFARPGCDRMHLSCSGFKRIFILSILYGSKLSNTSCSNAGSCHPFCCTREASDCVWNYAEHQMNNVYTNHRCWLSSECSSAVSHDITPCQGHTFLSTYAEADYSCLGDEDITDFRSHTTITAPAVAIHYDASDVSNYPVARGDNQMWHCQVDTADSVQRQADVILVKESYTGSSNSCSRVGWSGGSFLPCVPDFRYLTFNASTPFSVSVQVDGCNRLPRGWVVVRAQDGSSLTVTCGRTGQSLPSPCEDALTTPSTSQYPTSGWIGSEDKASGDGLTGVAVAGWVIAVLLAILLAVFSVLLLRRHGGWQNMIQLFKGKSSPGHLAGPRDQSSNYLHVISDTAAASQGGGPASVYDNAGLDRAASERNHVSSDQPRNEANSEYSPLDWSRDQANTYSPLRAT